MSWRGLGVSCRSVECGPFVQRKSQGTAMMRKASAAALRHMIALPIRATTLAFYINGAKSLPILARPNTCSTTKANDECSSLAACPWPSTFAFSSLSFVRFLPGLAHFPSILCLLFCPPLSPPALMAAFAPSSPTASLPPPARVYQISTAFVHAIAGLDSQLVKVLYAVSPPNVEKLDRHR